MGWSNVWLVFLYHFQPLFFLKCYTVFSVSDLLSVLSGSRRVLIWFFFSPLSLSSPLPCLWCWQCYTTIRQRFVHVFHQLHLCMSVTITVVLIVSSFESPSSWYQNHTCLPKMNQAWIRDCWMIVLGKSWLLITGLNVIRSLFVGLIMTGCFTHLLCDSYWA